MPGGELRTVAALALLAAALRAATALGLGLIMSDGPVFLGIAQDMAAGEWRRALEHAYHPLYPLATAAAYGLVGDWIAAGCLVSIAAGTAAVVALWALLRDAFDRRTAWIGAGMLAIHPYAIDYSSDVQSDGLYHALFLGAVALGWRALATRRLPAALGAGGAAGLAYLARPEGVGVVLVAAGIAGLEALRGAWPARRAAACAAALALGFGVVASPYLVALHEIHGEWTLTRKKSVAAVARLDGSAPASQPGESGDPRSGGSSLTPLLARVGPVAAAAAEVADVTWQGLRLDFLALALLGAWSVRGRPGLRARYLGGLAGAYVLVEFGLQLANGYSSKRHTVPPLSPLLGYAALGAPIAGRWIAERLRPFFPRALAAPAAPLALIAALLLAWNLPRDLAPRRTGDVASRRAAEWLKAQSAAPPAPVATHRSRVAFYAGAPYVSLRDAPAGGGGEELLAYLRAAGARYVILDDRDLDARASWRDATDRLPVRHEVSAGGRTARVYEVP
jgi:hypothetical protein